MTSADHNRYLVPAWSLSLLLHGVVVVVAMMFVGQVKPILPPETFKWDVALVEPVTPGAISELSEPVAPPVQRPLRAASPRPSEPMADATMNRVAPQRSAQMVHPKIEQPRPIEQKVYEPPRLEPTQPAAEVPQEATKPIEQNIVEAPEPIAEAGKGEPEPEPMTHHEPMTAQHQPVEHSIPAQAAEVPSPQARISPPPVEPLREAQHEEVTRPSSAVESTAAAPPAQAVSPPEAPPQVAKVAPPPDGKADHRWVGESLWRRVAELKRYPHSARLNGQEGKVILKAVIRSDGQLAEVTVLKSSGHHVLDSAAMEAVKLACPLHMKQAINKPQIVVSLPIVYSLAN